MINNKNDYPVPGTNNTSNANVASTTECTGLFQGIPEEDEQVEAYTEIYNVPEQKGLGSCIAEQDRLIQKQKEQ